MSLSSSENRQYKSKMKAAEYNPYYLLLLGGDPLVAVVIIKAAKEEVRRHCMKSENSV